MANIKDLATNPHPIYENNVHYWNFLLDSYEGGIDYTASQIRNQTGQIGDIITVNGKKFSDVSTASNLFKHKKERTADYETRLKMSYYYNFCSPIIDIYTNHLFKHPVDDDFGSIQATIDSKQDNIDRKGSSVDEFRKELSEITQIYGHAFVLVDSPRAVGTMISRQDQIDNDLFPYLNLFHPQKIINWALDSFGRPYWVLVCETQDGNINPFDFDKEARTMQNYRLWTRENWHLFNEDFQLIDEAPNPIGQVPIECIYHKPSKKVRSFLGVSSIADIGLIARDVYNLSSELREIIRNQTFSILALQGDSSQYDELTLGTNKAIGYPEGANPPQYVAPPEGPARIIMDQISSQVDKMFELAKLGVGSTKKDGSSVSQSGASKAWDFNETNAQLSKMAEHLMDGEERIWRTFAKWEGKEFDGTIQYPKEFSMSSLIDDLDELQAMMKAQIGNEAVKECKKSIIRKKFDRMPEEDINAIIEDSESTPTNSLLNRVSFLNRGTTNANIGGNNGGN